MAEVSEITDLVNAIGAVKGTKAKQTQQTKISDSGVNELVRQILAGPGGVKSIGNAARKSGLYNSTTEEDRLNDLYSSAAVKAELARSPTTTTMETPGVGLESVIGTLAMTSAAKSLMQGE